MQPRSNLNEGPVHVRVKLFALWVTVVFFYIYGDYFELYQPGKLTSMVEGRAAFGPVSQGILLGMSAIMIAPCLMPLLSIALPAAICRRANVFFGLLYLVVVALAIRGTWHFYITYGIIEIALTGAIVWYAWTWPQELEHKSSSRPHLTDATAPPAPDPPRP